MRDQHVISIGLRIYQENGLSIDSLQVKQGPLCKSSAESWYKTIWYWFIVAVGCVDPDPPRYGKVERVGNRAVFTCDYDSDVTWRATCQRDAWKGLTGNCTAGIRFVCVAYISVLEACINTITQICHRELFQAEVQWTTWWRCFPTCPTGWQSSSF